MIELNIAQVIGYSVQVLLILALLVALSIRSWPFLIAIVFMGLIALALACVRTSNTKQVNITQPAQNEVANFATLTNPELTSGHRELEETHGDYGSADMAPGPPPDIDSLDNVRPVNLALQGKEVSSQPARTKLSHMNPSNPHGQEPSFEGRPNLNRAPLMAAMHSKREKRSPFAFHQSAGFAGSTLYAAYLASTRQEAPEQAAHFPGAEAGQRYLPEKHAFYQQHKTRTQPQSFQALHPSQPPSSPHSLHNAAIANSVEPNEYGRAHAGYVRQYTSPYAQTAIMTTPDELEARHREVRWTYQSAQPMNGMPFASRRLLNQLGVENWRKPDPNLVPVNPRSRHHVPNILRPKQSAWATASYLHRK